MAIKKLNKNIKYNRQHNTQKISINKIRQNTNINEIYINIKTSI